MTREADAQAQRAGTLNDMGRHAEALAVVGPALLDHPGHVELLVQAALALDATGQWADAVAHGREAVRLSPDDVRAWRLLAHVLTRTGALDEAHAAARAALALAPHDPFSLLALSQVETARGRRATAVEAAEGALGLAPGLDAAHLQLATALTTGRRRPSGRTQRRAEQHVREVLRDHPHDPQVLAELARVQALRRFRMGVPDLALGRPRRPRVPDADRHRPPLPTGPARPSTGHRLVGLAHALALLALVGLSSPGLATGRTGVGLAIGSASVAGLLAGLAAGRPRTDGGIGPDVATVLVGVDVLALTAAALLSPGPAPTVLLGLPMLAGLLLTFIEGRVRRPG
ncbi:tetratricopeptide repeat protein [Lapillicoccus jejuensis]|uniref:Tetratricopeptide repeat protein n=1 Tax=Lapillicoccus jejuensis TaxID=402171 RepID=A0A542E030_9MICO|nr:tetratricopeptide repeat protein [Lapillicoccus jejuensis]TQJ08702.1 tetratricopeptide repeat protein [Lapillicoccus jejuensis]